MISRLAGESPDMALGRREHIDEGKGARRNSRLLPEEGSTVDVEPMKDPPCVRIVVASNN